METKFTKGPWEIADRVHCHIRQSGTRRGIANSGGYQTNIDGEAEVAQDENKANAHLIAAAPEMYEMLDKLLEWTPKSVRIARATQTLIGHEPNVLSAIEAMLGEGQAILAKARGEV